MANGWMSCYEKWPQKLGFNGGRGATPRIRWLWTSITAQESSPSRLVLRANAVDGAGAGIEKNL